MKLPIILCLMALALPGCQAVKHNTASGRPEIEVNKSVSEAKAAVASYLVNNKYQIVRDSELQVVADQDGTPGEQVVTTLLTDGYNMKRRITTTFISSGRSTRIVSDLALVRQQGLFGREEIVSTTDAIAGQQWQSALNEIATSLSRKK